MATGSVNALARPKRGESSLAHILTEYVVGGSTEVRSEEGKLFRRALSRAYSLRKQADTDAKAYQAFRAVDEAAKRWVRQAVTEAVATALDIHGQYCTASNEDPKRDLESAVPDDHSVRGFRSEAGELAAIPLRPRQNLIAVGDLTVDVEKHEVRVKGRPVQLGRIEFRLLHLLAVNQGRIIEPSRLVDFAWGYQDGDVTLLKYHISHIRKKLQLPAGGAGSIEGIRGIGYRLNTR